MTHTLVLSMHQVYNVFVKSTLYTLLRGVSLGYMSDATHKMLDILNSNLSVWPTMLTTEEVTKDQHSATVSEIAEVYTQRLFASNDRTKLVSLAMNYPMIGENKQITPEVLDIAVIYTRRRMGSDEKTYSGSNACTAVMDIKDLMDVYTTAASKEVLTKFMARMTDRVNMAVSLLEQSPMRPKDTVTTMPQYKTKQHPYLV